jgi:hypothetical protein
MVMYSDRQHLGPRKEVGSQCGGAWPRVLACGMTDLFPEDNSLSKVIWNNPSTYRQKKKKKKARPETFPLALVTQPVSSGAQSRLGFWAPESGFSGRLFLPSQCLNGCPQVHSVQGPR